MSEPKPMTYAGTGVVYGILDRFKRAAQEAAKSTAQNIRRLLSGELQEYEPSRGESAFLMKVSKAFTGFIAHVQEGLGTKNLVADAMQKLTGKSFYDNISQCTVAMIVNDLITMGALPLSVAMHLSAGNSAWFNDEARSADLIKGWKRACDLARCIWGPGETPTLKGIVNPATVELSGSAIGIIEPANRLITDAKIENFDDIIIVESSGIHANGLTLAREIGERKDSTWRVVLNALFPKTFPLRALPEGYLTKLSDGRAYGETLLDPTHIYVGFVEDCLNAGVDIHYAVNITGHGWRKLMRSLRAFIYYIHTLPTQLPIFDFIQKHGPVDDMEAYGNLNMGAGFAIYVRKHQSAHVIAIAAKLGFKAFVAGEIQAGERKVVIAPKGLIYEGDTLEVRG